MKIVRPALVLFVSLWLLVGLAFPFVVSVIGNVAFPWQAHGSLIQNTTGTVVGSALIGQSFTDPKYFWGRPSATSVYPYNALASGGSNLGPTNPVLLASIEANAKTYRASNPAVTGDLPSDLVESSASGLDPDLSTQAVLLQVPRVAKARGLNETMLTQLVLDSVNNPLPGVLGTPRVNVLELNLKLDGVTLQTANSTTH